MIYITILFSFILFIPSISQAQCDQVRTEVDKFSSDTVYTSGVMFVQGGYKQMVYFIGRKTGNGTPELFVSVEKPGVTCFKEVSKAVFLFDDGSKDTLISNRKLNCKGELSFPLDGYINKFGNLSTKKISDIRFFSTNGYFDIQLDKSEEIFLSRSQIPVAIKCITQ